MRLGLLTGVAALSLIGAAAAQAETIYASDTEVLATTPGAVYAVPAPPFGPFTPQYIVTQPTIVVAPPAAAPVVAPAIQAAPRERVIERERVVIAPPGRAIAPRERVVVRERVIAPRERVVERVVAPRERVIERERVVIAPAADPVVVPPQTGIVTTGYSSSGCFLDRNGFERCY
jgi:hypothetical protein